MGETAVDLLADPPSHVQDARELPLAGGLVRNLPVLKGPVHGGEEGEDLFVLLPLSDLKDKRLHVVHVVGRVEDGAVVRCKGPHLAADEGAGEGHLLQRGGGVLALHFGSSQVAAVQKLHKTFIPRFPHRSTPAVAAGVLGARQRVFGNTQHMMLCVADH